MAKLSFGKTLLKWYANKWILVQTRISRQKDLFHYSPF